MEFDRLGVLGGSNLKMYRGEGVDWYEVSKMSEVNVEKLKQLVEGVDMAYGVERVSLTYRKKLLILFQQASRAIRTDTPNLAVTHAQLLSSRSILADKLATAEAETENSFKELSNMKMIVAEKKRVLGKLRERLEKASRGRERKVYCCGQCPREDFSSAEQLRAHVEAEHQLRRDSQVYDLKELLLTMKDKEMEMMSMFLRASREMQTDRAEKDYDQEVKKHLHVSGTKTEQSHHEEEEDMQELKGESQFLFFQQSEHFRRQMENDQQFRRSLVPQPAPQSYYDFPSQFDLGSSGPTPAHPELSHFLRNQTNPLSKDSRFSLVDNTPKPFLELRQAKLVESAMPISLSDRLREGTKRQDTLFSTRRRLLEDYVFNSGPLMDDKGDSDYEDYFGGKQTGGAVEDEEIRVVGRESFHLSKLLSPKEQSGHSLLADKEKSSVIVDLSESFSKRDFQVSKDEETINLSELKLSKLEKKREEEKHRLREVELSQEKRSFVSDSNIDSKNNSSKVNSSKIAAALERHSKVSDDTPPAPSDLRDFIRPLAQPQVHPIAPLNHQSLPKKTYKLPQRVTLLTGKQQVRMQNSLGVLNEFLRKQVQGQAVGRDLEMFLK